MQNNDPKIISSYSIVEFAIDSAKNCLGTSYKRIVRELQESHPFPDYLISYEGIIAYKNQN